MSTDWLTRLYDLAMFLSGTIVGAWVYYRGLNQQSPIPPMSTPASFVRRKPTAKANDLPRVGA